VAGEFHDLLTFWSLMEMLLTFSFGISPDLSKFQEGDLRVPPLGQAQGRRFREAAEGWGTQTIWV
jgi:hypothetical protein